MSEEIERLKAHIDGNQNINGAEAKMALDLIESQAAELSELRERVKALEGAVLAAIGWTVVDACVAIDEGRDYRKESMPEIIQRAMNDLDLLSTGREEG